MEHCQRFCNKEKDETKNEFFAQGEAVFIGTHYFDLLSKTEHKYINLDIKHPHKGEHNSTWIECDILDLPKLLDTFTNFQPTHILHLAATADTYGTSLDCYQTNITGTLNVLNAVRETPCIEQTLITSTQHVRKPGSPPPKNDIDFLPYGFYGESKVITEKFTREAKLPSPWTIIRPTTIWGPYHPHLVSGLWRVMKLGLYIHPSNDPVIRSTGFVKNTVWQIYGLQNSNPAKINKKVFYVGEKSMRQLDWVNALSLGITGNPVKENA